MCEIKEELDTLPMRAMLAAAFITYLSSATEDRRRHCLDTWMTHSGLQSEEDFTLSSHNVRLQLSTMDNGWEVC